MISNKRLKSIASCMASLKAKNYRKFQAWLLHHLHIDPSLCGVKMPYHHFFGPEPAKVKPGPVVKSEPIQIVNRGDQETLILKRYGELPRDGVAMRTNHKRRKLDPSPDLQRQIAQETSQEATHQTVHQTSHQTSYVDPSASSGLHRNSTSTAGGHFTEPQANLISHMLRRS